MLDDRLFETHEESKFKRRRLSDSYIRKTTHSSEKSDELDSKLKIDMNTQKRSEDVSSNFNETNIESSSSVDMTTQQRFTDEKMSERNSMLNDRLSETHEELKRRRRRLSSSRLDTITHAYEKIDELDSNLEIDINTNKIQEEVSCFNKSDDQINESSDQINESNDQINKSSDQINESSDQINESNDLIIESCDRFNESRDLKRSAAR